MLQNNQTAPSFSVVDEKGNIINSSDFLHDKNIVLYFYPKDDTPGCTIEGNQFTALVEEFTKENTVIFGVSKDSCESHQAFIDKFDYKISLLADTSGELCDAYNVWQEKEKNGVKTMGIVRSTFIIDQKGVLQHAKYNVVAEGHAVLMLKRIKSL